MWSQCDVILPLWCLVFKLMNVVSTVWEAQLQYLLSWTCVMHKMLIQPHRWALVLRVSHWGHRINPSITLWPSQSELCRVVRTAGDVEDGAGSQAHQCKWRLIGSFNMLLWYYGIYLFWCVNVASILIIIIELQGFISGNMLDCDWFSTFSVWKFAFLKTANLCL